MKLPGSSPEEVDSIIGFEAQQNVPFPIDEVVWDYQIMGEAKDNQWDVVLVAIKADQLDEINASVNKGGLRTLTIDVADGALNAFRYNYSELTDARFSSISARGRQTLFSSRTSASSAEAFLWVAARLAPPLPRNSSRTSRSAKA